MKVAVFLDVDKTLTRNFIQQEYAKAMGCEPAYAQLEARLGKDLNFDEFGEEIISLFASKQLNEDQARGYFHHVALQPWTDVLLGLKVDIYLVSSGPSYYIDRLAETYRIPNDQVCRSEYKFSRRDGIIESCNAISPQQKADFVSQKAKRYAITVGVGDSPSFDGPFISQCTIPILTVRHDHYFYVPSFDSIVLMVRRLSDNIANDPETFEPNQLTIPQLFRSLTVGGWTLLGSGFLAAGGVGAWAAKFFR
jgi:phosphoserine phosphatase